MRQLAAASEYRRSHDAQLANSLLGFRPPGDSVAPSWLLEEGRAHSTAIYKQNIRVRQGKGRGDGDGDGAGRGGRGKGRGGRGRGRGAGRGKEEE